jgi:hypothetical protein
MAKVKIQGNASGTGVLTITAPNTSTDRTITLPDSTGTILDNTSTLDATKLSGDLPAISAASLTNVPKDTTVGGRKNLIINGNMDVWQRGTPIATMGFGADRWKTYSTASGVANYNVTNTQVADNPISAGGYSYSVAVDNASTSIDFITVTQLIEQANLTSINTGDSLTLSFWIKKTRDLDSNATFKVMAMTPASSKDTWSGVQYQSTDSLASTPFSENYNSLSTSWVKKTATFTVTANMVTRGLGLCFQIGESNVTSGAGSTAEIYRFTGVQLEKGSTATDFEYRSYGEELALCQRYYERFIADASAEMLIGVGVNASATDVFINYPYKQIKRVIPSFSSSGASHFERLTASWGAGSSINCQANIATARLNMGGFPSSTIWNATEVRITAAANDAHWFAFDAEL